MGEAKDYTVMLCTVTQLLRWSHARTLLHVEEDLVFKMTFLIARNRDSPSLRAPRLQKAVFSRENLYSSSVMLLYGVNFFRKIVFANYHDGHSFIE